MGLVGQQLHKHPSQLRQQIFVHGKYCNGRKPAELPAGWLSRLFHWKIRNYSFSLSHPLLRIFMLWEARNTEKGNFYEKIQHVFSKTSASFLKICTKKHRSFSIYSDSHHFALFAFSTIYPISSDIAYNTSIAKAFSFIFLDWYKNLSLYLL